MSQDDTQLGQHYHVLMRLAKSKVWGRGNLDSTLREVTEAAAHTLGIERVNVWLFDEERTKITCVEHYERSRRKHSKGVEILAADYPIYFKALDEERTIVANDAHSDPRTSEFSEGYLDANNITSMLDAPLHSGGKVIGIVCHEHVGPPRIWTTGEQQFAASLADIASQALEAWERRQAEEEIHKLNAELEQRVKDRTAQLKAVVTEKEDLLEELQASSVELLDRLFELERKSETIRNDLERAQVIQRALLPAEPPSLEGVHCDALYRPGMNVGGDLYDVAVLEDGRVALYVADAAGHGVAAAMLSVLFKQRLEMCDPDGSALAPAEVLRRVNSRLAGDVSSQGLFLTAGYVLLDLESGELSAASAGHTPMVLRRANGENVLLERTGPALGLRPDADFTEHDLTFAKGDRLILYTDGLTEGLEPDVPGEIDETDGILELLAPALDEGTGDAPRRLRALYEGAVRRARGVARGEDHDDVTLLMLTAESGTSTFDNGSIEDSVPADDVPSAPPPPSTRDSTLWVSESEQTTHLHLRGRGTWVTTETFRRLAQDSLDSGRELVIDLKDCLHLDSAFLGTVHEIVTSRPGGKVSILTPCATVRALFVELGLEEVLAAVSDAAAGPPCEPKPVVEEAPARESQMRLLRAHEVLSELSEENRERFSGVVQALRAELGQREKN